MAAESVSEFITENPALSLSPKELARARAVIDKSIIIDPNLFGQLQEGFMDDTGTTNNPEELLYCLKYSTTSEEKLDKLTSFLWASACGCNGNNGNNDLTKLHKAPMGSYCVRMRDQFEAFKVGNSAKLLASSRTQRQG